jgi:hypothetical protein
MKRWPVLLAAVLLAGGCNRKLPLVSVAADTPARFKAVGIGQSNILEKFHLVEYFLSHINAATKVDEYAAQGATPLSAWSPGQPLYDLAVAASKDADVIIFWQGEYEAHDINMARTWGDQWVSIIRSLRAAIGRNVPIVAIRLGHGDTNDDGTPTAAWAEMQRQQDYAFAHTPNVVAVDISGVPDELRYPQDVHYTDEGYKLIASWAAEAYKERSGN